MRWFGADTGVSQAGKFEDFMALIDNLSKTFDAKAAADKYYPQWEASGVFTPDPDAPGEPYVIVIPPPNVTGSLHMGHALDNTLQDVLIRFKRMDGFDARRG